MVLRIEGVVGGRGGLLSRPETDARVSGTYPGLVANAPRSIKQRFYDLLGWAHRGYSQTNAGDLAAAVAFNALVALIPTFLLLLAVTGIFFQSEQVFTDAVQTSVWLPRGEVSDALTAVLAVERSSSWLGAFSLAGFAWTGTGFVSCLARSMNRIYGVPGCGYMCEKRRGFFVMLAFAALFILALAASIVPSLFVGQDLPSYFQGWRLAEGWYQLLGYLVAGIAGGSLFGMLYRVVPNARQTVRDVWPGTLTAALLFVGMSQVFPVYLRLIGGVNRYGAVFGLISLLVAWFYVLAHLLLFGTYVNATFLQRRRMAGRRPVSRQA